MPKYLVSWTEKLWFTAEIEADSKEEAREMVLDQGVVWAEPYDSEIQDSIEVEEVME